MPFTGLGQLQTSLNCGAPGGISSYGFTSRVWGSPRLKQAKLCGVLADLCNVYVSSRVRAGLRVFAAFVMSGFAHEYLVYAAFGSVSGTYMVFFGLHCLGVLMEGSAPRIPEHGLLSKRHAFPPSMTRQPASTEGALQRTHRHSKREGPLHNYVGGSQRSNTGWLQRCWAWAVCFLTLPLFFEPLRIAGMYSRCAFQPFGIPLVPRLIDCRGSG